MESIENHVAIKWTTETSLLFLLLVMVWVLGRCEEGIIQASGSGGNEVYEPHHHGSPETPSPPPLAPPAHSSRFFPAPESRRSIKFAWC